VAPSSLPLLWWLSLHVSQALLCHFFEIDMTWGATAKEVEDTTFFEEMPRLLKHFKGTFIFCILCAGIMVAGAFFLSQCSGELQIS